MEANLKAGDWAVFPGGGGGVGIQGVQLAKAMGYRPIAIDTGAAKRELCLKMGATHFVDFKETESVTAAIIELTDGIGAHAVIVTAPAAYKDAVSFTGRRVRSKVLCIGLRKSPGYLAR
jgi:propanol-preferring alcohol dehydrogenase